MFLANAVVKDFLVRMPFNSKLFPPENGFPLQQLQVNCFNNACKANLQIFVFANT